MKKSLLEWEDDAVDKNMSVSLTFISKIEHINYFLHFILWHGDDSPIPLLHNTKLSGKLS